MHELRDVCKEKILLSALTSVNLINNIYSLSSS